MSQAFVWFDLRTKDADTSRSFDGQAEELGATVLQLPTERPAGTSTPIREPGGAVLALFHARS